MKTNILHKLAIFIGIAFCATVIANTISRVKNFSDGEILTAADLNAEFNNVVDGVNSITNDNIANNAAISPAKISSAIKGSGITRNTTSGSLSLNVDNSTVEIVNDNLQVKNAGITGAKLNDNVVDDITIEKTGTTLNIKDGGVGSTQIANGAVTQAKRASLNLQTSSSSGTFNITNSSSTYSTVTNLSVTITTTGRPVFVGLMSDGTNTTATTEACLVTDGGFYRFARGSSSLGGFFVGSNSVPCTSFFVIDSPSAGTYTYSFQQRTSGGSQRRDVTRAVLIAYEL
jgi:hypothetical protein